MGELAWLKDTLTDWLTSGCAGANLCQASPSQPGLLVSGSGGLQQLAA